MDLREYGRVLIRRGWIVIVVAIVGALGALLVQSSANADLSLDDYLERRAVAPVGLWTESGNQKSCCACTDSRCKPRRSPNR